MVRGLHWMEDDPYTCPEKNPLWSCSAWRLAGSTGGWMQRQEFLRDYGEIRLLYFNSRGKGRRLGFKPGPGTSCLDSQSHSLSKVSGKFALGFRRRGGREGSLEAS